MGSEKTLVALVVAGVILLLFGSSLMAFATNIVNAIKSGDWTTVTQAFNGFIAKLTDWFNNLKNLVPHS